MNIGKCMAAGATIVMALGLQACGNDRDPVVDYFGSERLFIDYSNAVEGGYRSVRTPISDTTHSADTRCGYVTPFSVSDFNDYIADVGGTVTTATDEIWCGTAPSETYCVLRAGASFITDDFIAGAPDQRAFEIVIPDDDNDTRAYFTLTINGTTPQARADIERYTSAIPSSGSCTPSTPMQFASDINGNWKGYRVTYDRASKIGSEVSATMSCSAGSCTVGGASFGSIPFSSFLAVGSWQANWNNRVAGATIIDDRDALAMYVCPAPLDERDVVDDCAFYGFRREG